ncbi:MAG: ribonuclease HI [Neisseriaceae bacterium]
MITDDKVYLYADGACKGNPGIGGWGVLLRYKQHEKELYGGQDYTTNNQMELTAVIKGLQQLRRSSRVEIYTDSQYVRNGITTWIKKWKSNQWKTSAKQPVKNQDLWMALDEAVKGHQINWHWVKGHQGNEGNERADQLANLGCATVKGSNFRPPNF